MRRQREALLLDIERILLELDQATSAWVADTVAASYRQGMGNAIAMIPGAAAPTLTIVHRRAIELLADNMLTELADARQRLGRHAIDRLRTIGLEESARKVASSDTVRGATKAIARRLRDEGVRPPGMMRIDAYANLVARSTTREASNLGSINATTEAGHSLVQITTHRSPCPVCSQYEGRVYTLDSSRNDDYPDLRSTAFSGGYNNIHPNCRHVVTPYIPALADDPTQDRQVSNQPFVDTRSDREAREYRRAQTRKRQQADNRRQWERYREVFGDDMPDYSTFVRQKNSGSDSYQQLLSDYRRVISDG